MNLEEKKWIIVLYKKYSDNFYIADKPLTLTNQIKHSIKTKDEQ